MATTRSLLWVKWNKVGEESWRAKLSTRSAGRPLIYEARITANRNEPSPTFASQLSVTDALGRRTEHAMPNKGDPESAKTALEAKIKAMVGASYHP
jgi:hypothetical protein